MKSFQIKECLFVHKKTYFYVFLNLLECYLFVIGKDSLRLQVVFTNIANIHFFLTGLPPVISLQLPFFRLHSWIDCEEETITKSFQI